VNLNFLHRRRWWLAFLGVGILLNGLAVINSDLGLDVHVRLNVANDENNMGPDYPWGPTRWADSDVQMPFSSGEYEGYIGPWYSSPIAVQVVSFLSIVILSLLAGYVPAWRREKNSPVFEPMWSALVAWSPCLMFATGRGYDEAILAIVLGISVVWLFFVDGSKTRHLRVGILMMATSVMCVLGWKGFGPLTAFVAWLAVIAVGNLWLIVDERISHSDKVPITQHPWLMGGIFFGTTLAGITLIGWLGYGGTFSVIQDYPWVFLLSLPFSFLDGIILFLLIGFCFWPFFNPSNRMMALRGRTVTMLSCFCAIIGAGIVAYIGALWTLESQLWNISLFQCMLVLGNNGRYATILVLPLLMLLHLSQTDENGSEDSLKENVSTKSLFIALLILLPVVFFTAFHGQQLWQEDAGSSLAVALEGENQSFLLISDESLAMHSLYVLKTNTDLDGSSNLNGYWRSPNLANEFLNGSEVDAIIIAPGVDFVIDVESWSAHTAQSTPFSISSGSSNDEWILYLPS